LRACELASEPDQLHLNRQVSLAYFYSGDYSNAVSFVRRAVEKQPHHMMGYVLLGRAEAQLGNWEQAISAFTRGVEISGGSLFSKALLASAYAGSGDESRAREILNQLSAERGKEGFPSYDVSAAYAVLKQEREALKFIRMAFEKRDMMTLYISQDPRFSRLRSSEEFRKLSSSISAEKALPMVI
jgi:tetratricopeptide (TPR) repeat protein